MSNKMEEATLGGGCFWCLEAVFQRLKGVELCESGYSGGPSHNANYEAVCGGNTGHVEVVRLRYNPDEISFQTLLEVFFTIHDPTTLNRQGNDVGTQYRSVIFYHNDEQREIAQGHIAKLESDRGFFSSKIVTAVEPLVNYFPGEKYHQNYYENNPYQGYCAYVVAPKVEKAGVKFTDLMKKP